MSSSSMYIARNRRRDTRRRKGTVTVALAAAAMLALPALAAPGGNGKGPDRTAEAAATCWVEGDWVYAAGLPTNEVVNFLVSDDTGLVDAWVLGENWDGTDMVQVAERTGPTTYEFVSEMKGKDGSRYDVHATCTADA